jgi:hypothetical protein
MDLHQDSTTRGRAVAEARHRSKVEAILSPSRSGNIMPAMAKPVTVVFCRSTKEKRPHDGGRRQGMPRTYLTWMRFM